MSEHAIGQPTEALRRWLRETWRTLKMVYYANSASWRALKSGALVFFGFFLWSSANLLLSYQPGWQLLNYVMAYGFVLIWYGPLHHLVVIPIALRLRRGGSHPTVGRHLPNASLAFFLAIVLVLGTFPMSPMTVSFTAALDEAGADIDPQLLCTKGTGAGGATIHCHLSDSEGIDAVVVESAGERLLIDEEPPFEFTIREDELNEVVGQKQFQVVLLDENGNTIRRYTRTTTMIR